LLLLPLELSRIARLNRLNFSKAWPRSDPPNFFDRVVVSGDISTDATDDARFAFAHDFLTSVRPLALPGPYALQAAIGLGIANDLLLTLPGNHDKMRETTLTRFNSAFGKSPTACNYVRAFRRNGNAIVFFVMDSNDYGEGNIAKGEVDQARLSWLANEIGKIESGIVEGEPFSAQECSSAVRCLVLHHHACDLSFKKRFFSIGRSFTQMTGASDLLKLISGRIHVILHGHEHYPTHFFERESGALIISAGSTSQWQKKTHRNSFYHLTFFTENGVQVDEYVWTGKGFVSRQKLMGVDDPIQYKLRDLAK